MIRHVECGECGLIFTGTNEEFKDWVFVSPDEDDYSGFGYWLCPICSIK